jgi:hypothetical protein
MEVKLHYQKMVNYSWKSKEVFSKKKGKRIFITALSPPSFTFENYKEGIV